MAYQLKQAKKELAHFSTCPKVDKEDPVIVHLSSAPLPLGPIAMPQNYQSIPPAPATGYSSSDAPPPTQPRSVRKPPGNKDSLISAKITTNFGEKYGIHHGVVTSYNDSEELFMVEYADGDKEEMYYDDVIKGLVRYSNFQANGKL